MRSYWYSMDQRLLDNDSRPSHQPTIAGHTLVSSLTEACFLQLNLDRAIAGSYLSPVAAQFGSQVGSYTRSLTLSREGSGVTWLRSWVRNLGVGAPVTKRCWTSGNNYVSMISLHYRKSVDFPLSKNGRVTFLLDAYNSAAVHRTNLS